MRILVPLQFAYYVWDTPNGEKPTGPQLLFLQGCVAGPCRIEDAKLLVENPSMSIEEWKRKVYKK
jgi:hypothetical protein